MVSGDWGGWGWGPNSNTFTRPCGKAHLVMVMIAVSGRRQVVVLVMAGVGGVTPGAGSLHLPWRALADGTPFTCTHTAPFLSQQLA